MDSVALRWIRKITADWVSDPWNAPYGGTWVYNDARAAAYAQTHWAVDLDVRARVGSAYEVLLGRAPDAGGWRYWVDQVELRSFGRVLEDLWIAAKANGEAFAPTTDAASWAQGLFHLFLDRDPTAAELATWSQLAGSTAASRMLAASAFVAAASLELNKAEVPTLLQDLAAPSGLTLGEAQTLVPTFQEAIGGAPPHTLAPTWPAVVVIDSGWHAEAVVQAMREYYDGPVILRDVGADIVNTQVLLDEVRWALDHAEAYGIRVINLSWADTPGVAENQWSEYYDRTALFQEAAARGISIVVAAGNHASMSSFPDGQWGRPYWSLTSGLADSSYVLAVSAVVEGSTIEDFAPYSATVDVYTSGRVVYEGILDPSISGQTVRGTSFAAPRVAGAVAALKAAGQAEGVTMGLAEVRAAMRLGATYEEARRNTVEWLGGQRYQVLDPFFGPGAALPQQRWFWSDGLARAVTLAGSVWDDYIDPRARVAAAYDFLLGRAPDPGGWRFWVDHLEDHDFSSVLRSIWAAARENDDVANAQSEVADWVSGMFVLFLDRFPTDHEYATWIARGFEDVAPGQYGVVPRAAARADVAHEFIQAYSGELDLDLGSVPEIVQALGLDGSLAAAVFRDLTPAGLRGYDLTAYEGWQPFGGSGASVHGVSWAVDIGSWHAAGPPWASAAAQYPSIGSCWAAATGGEAVDASVA
jgi:hypothetical protein